MRVALRTSAAPRVVLEAVATDLSLAGMRLRTDAALKVGDRIAIDCVFCSAVAVVKSTLLHQGVKAPLQRVECGIEFVTLLLRKDRGGLVSTMA
jgi:hypothetical protein